MICEFRPAIDWKDWQETGKVNTAFESTTSGVSASGGETPMRMTSKSWITTRRY